MLITLVLKSLRRCAEPNGPENEMRVAHRRQCNAVAGHLLTFSCSETSSESF